MVGSVLQERYRIDEQLDAGGMGTIYKAHDLVEDEDVAIKVLARRKAATEEYRERFHREYSLCAGLSHPNIVKMYAFGTTEEQQPFYAMELLPRTSLHSMVREQGHLPQERVLNIVDQLLSAFRYFHGLGIVHRDLKPENVMVRLDGSVALTDFGIARTDDQAPITATGITMGTPNYISPEVLQGEEADPRSDIFALGIIVYELLTGTNPFGASSLDEVITKIVRTTPSPPTELRAELHEHWNPFVARCLSKNRDERYQSADEVAEDCYLLQEALGIAVTRPAPPKPATSRGCASVLLLFIASLAALMLI